MIEKIKELKDNKKLKFVTNVLYTLMFIFIVLMLIIVVMQRFSNNNIAIGGFRLFSVATGSMVPKYDVGDILISKEIKPEKIKVGDDIVYQGEKGSFSGKIVTHRVISIEKKDDGNYEIITQGIANNAADPSINQTQVYGKVISEIHVLSFIQKLIQNPYTFYILIFIPIGILVAKRVRYIINMDEEMDEDCDGEDCKNTEEDKD